MRALLQLIRFGWEQALSCLFPVVIFASLAISQLIRVSWLPRYDLLLLICLVMQWWMVHSGLETGDEVKVITLFHLIGVPLYSGFMYASVASYLCQAWRRLQVELVRWPPYLLVVPLALTFVLVGFFIWIAENVATFFGAWEYPDQSVSWQIVHFGKVSSWLLLVIVSFLIVATLKRVKDDQALASKEAGIQG